jgi:DNA-binding MarR family transcriptional regulator
VSRPAKAAGKGRKLSNFLCFAVYSANLAFGRAYKPLLDKVGLTYTQYIAMVALSDEDEQTVSALGDKLFLESNTLTPILKKLEQNGYIKRHRDSADERQVRVSLTPAGRRLIEQDLGCIGGAVRLRYRHEGKARGSSCRPCAESSKSRKSARTRLRDGAGKRRSRRHHHHAQVHSDKFGLQWCWACSWNTPSRMGFASS